MRKHTSVTSLYDAQVRLFATGQYTMKTGHERLARASLADMSELTKGAVKSKTLRALGHPYGRGATSAASTPTGLMRGPNKKAKQILGRSKLPPLPINKQTGKLRSGMYLRRAASSTKQTFVLGSSAPYAKYQFSPTGTKRMVARGLMGGKAIGINQIGAIERRWRQRNRAFLDYFVRKQRT